jgi:hypothetical protein
MSWQSNWSRQKYRLRRHPGVFGDTAGYSSNKAEKPKRAMIVLMWGLLGVLVG